MKAYENDKAMVDELFNIFNYLQSKYENNSEVLEASYDVQEVAIKIAGLLEV